NGEGNEDNPLKLDKYPTEKSVFMSEKNKRNAERLVIDDDIEHFSLLKGLPNNRGKRTVDQAKGTRRNKPLIIELFAQLEMTRYAKNGSDLVKCVNTLEDTLKKTINAQEEHIKYLEVSLKGQQERCVELNEKWYKAENLCKEVMTELEHKKEEILHYQREIEAFDGKYAQLLQINEKNQHIINHYRCTYDYSVESDTEIVSLYQQKQTLEQQLREVHNSINVYNNAYQNEKAERKQSEDHFHREFQQMQQKCKDAEARAAELQRKNNLLKDEVTRS
ncbi:779_t:CDS:1, partial [Paraglomus occultum]